MKKLKNSDFCTIKEVMSMMKFKPVISECEETSWMELWIDVAGNKIAKFSRIVQYSKQSRSLTIACKNSQIANELYLEHDTLLQLIKESQQKFGTDDVDSIKIILDKKHK